MRPPTEEPVYTCTPVIITRAGTPVGGAVSLLVHWQHSPTSTNSSPERKADGVGPRPEGWWTRHGGERIGLPRPTRRSRSSGGSLLLRRTAPFAAWACAACPVNVGSSPFVVWPPTNTIYDSMWCRGVFPVYGETVADTADPALAKDTASESQTRNICSVVDEGKLSELGTTVHYGSTEWEIAPCLTCQTPSPTLEEKKNDLRRIFYASFLPRVLQIILTVLQDIISRR